ncbi:Uncharacterised protein [Mycobacteroides abscessus subsp. abscessus]|nr:Uncharacterised protein [Mycobacteroides abscessus subsp. abscessus]
MVSAAVVALRWLLPRPWSTATSKPAEIAATEAKMK